MTPASVTIRAAIPEDAEAICAMRGMPGVRRGTLSVPFESASVWRKYIEDKPRGDIQIVAEREGAVVGNAFLGRFAGRRGHCGTIGMMVRDDCQGTGVGTALMQALVEAADKWLGLLRLELEVNCDNAPALALYRRFGFVVEGRLVANAFRDGEHIDCFAMARLAGALADRRTAPELPAASQAAMVSNRLGSGA